MWGRQAATMGNPGACLAPALSVAFLLLLTPEVLCEQIIGGHKVTPHSRPYMALLTGMNSICAGALIEDRWVLTAAHCRLNKSSRVILGAHSRSNREPEKQIMSVKEQFPYHRYDKHTHEGDLQLVQLQKKATITKDVAILPLPKEGRDVKPGTRCQVAGWGAVNNQMQTLDLLREVNVTVIDRRVCNDRQHYDYNPVIGLSMLCAGSPKGGKDSCNGDSGSPLICEGTFRGITSFGKPRRCGDPRWPGVYVLLTQKYLAWIISIIKRAA